MNPNNNFFDTNIAFSRGIGEQRALLLSKEMGIHSYRDLLQYYPYRYDDRTTLHALSNLSHDTDTILIKGKILNMKLEGEGSKKRLTATFSDGSGAVELVWFRSISWHRKNLRYQIEYLVFGKPTYFNGKWSLTHPDIDPLIPGQNPVFRLTPVYSIPEKLRKKHIDSRVIYKAVEYILEKGYALIPETLPASLITKYRLFPKKDAIYHIHLPANSEYLHQAKRRLKFEELFYNQLQLIKNKFFHKNELPGAVFSDFSLVREFYLHHLPFQLTAAQVRVLKEIKQDLQSGVQMNRLLQGDVGSGKTIVAFIAALMAVSNQFQVCLMAPTEILAEQHFKNFEKLAGKMGIKVGILVGATRKKQREILHKGLREGDIHIVIGTHALIEDEVRFKNLGLCIIDEQHRFGVAQRAKLQEKSEGYKPHILVMTATPIPRTLAMTLYGDLDQSEIDELPPGRKPVVTIHRYDKHRSSVFGFIREQLNAGRQIYLVYPLIEESEKSDLKDLMDGYESISRAFPDVPLSIVHGKMKPQDKAYEMNRFVRNETKILVATTVIEVGVDVPNASVMVIENAERFGLAQLHQLRGRVGRGADQAYCILMTSYKLSTDTRKRIDTMCRTQNGFEIAQVDLELRGPGDLMGTQQSGTIELKVANLAVDGAILKEARASAYEILEKDPELAQPEHQMIRGHLTYLGDDATNWSRIG